MDETSLAWFIQQYINERRQAKLDALDKDAAKQLANANSDSEQQEIKFKLAEKRADIEARFKPQAWLTDAARQASQIHRVTHPSKYTHSDEKGNSIYYSPIDMRMSESYLSTASLPEIIDDIDGNAAAFGVGKLLQTEHHGDSLIAALQRDDHSALQVFASDAEQCASWVNGFKQVLENSALASHKRAKQIYFPVGKQRWHLLSPLLSSSLVHAVHQRIIDVRFSDESKEIRTALKEKKWHSKPRTFFNDTAILNFGGTKPQNISYLNSVRGGKVYLLSCAAPQWQSARKLPLKYTSIFTHKGDVTFLTELPVAQLKNYLLTVKTKNMQDRQQVKRYIDTIIDIIFNYVVALQNDEKIAGWTQQKDCQLTRAYQLWLDPRRALNDDAFRQERETETWKETVARDFSLWLNAQLKDDKLNVGETERREWQAKPLFKTRMREGEKMLKEVLA